MAIKNTKLGGTDISGELVADYDLNDTFNACARLTTQVYTGTGFNTTITGAGSNEDSHELDAIVAAKLTGATYIKITIVGKADCTHNSENASSKIEYKIQTKYTGGAYVTRIGYNTLYSLDHQTNYTNSTSTGSVVTTVYYYTLSNDDKTNGAQVKIYTNCTAGTNGVAEFSNTNTIIEVI